MELSGALSLFILQTEKNHCKHHCISCHFPSLSSLLERLQSLEIVQKFKSFVTVRFTVSLFRVLVYDLKDNCSSLRLLMRPPKATASSRGQCLHSSSS